MHRHPLARLTPMRRDRLNLSSSDTGVPLKALARRRWNQPADRIQLVGTAQATFRYWRVERPGAGQVEQP